MQVSRLQPVPVADIEAFIKQNEEKDLLRFSTAGSVDDGKSTLIGRLLYDSNGVYEDQLASVRRSPINRSSGAFDLALLTDGLRAEREQGITIDVAYRYFSTPRRKFIIADTPGHEQYTRNMATGASNANLAVVLVDARNGVLAQSRRHAFIASMLGIQHIVVAVNKMDLVGYSEQVFERICDDFTEYASSLQIPDLHFIPMSALHGDNVVEKSHNMPWFDGASLLHYLETVHIASDRNLTEFRFPVQYVLRPDQDFRGYAGQVVSGVVKKGDAILVLPSGRTTRVRSIVSYDGELPQAFPPMSVALCLEDEIDIGRGDMLVSPSHSPHVTRQVDSRLVWMHEDPLRIGRTYLLKHNTQTVPAIVESVRYRVNTNTLEREDSARIGLNDIGAVVLQTHKPIFCDPYRRNRVTGSFILVEPVTNATVAAGMITGREPAKLHVASPKLELPCTSDQPVTRLEQVSRAGHRAVTICIDASAEIALRLERVLFEGGCRVHAIPNSNSDATTLGIRCRTLNDAGVIAIIYGSITTAMQCELGKAIGEENLLKMDAPAHHESAETAVDRYCGQLENDDVIRQPHKTLPGPTILHKGFTLWFTGMSGSGKSTISRLLDERLRTFGAKVEVLDGDVVRTHLSKGLGFSREDRDENIRRIGFVCDRLSSHGVIAIAAAISPYRAAREEVRARISNFVEVYVHCPMEVLVARDVKGLYRQALAGEIPSFTGVSDPYEPPLNPEVTVNSATETPEQILEKIWTVLKNSGLVSFTQSRP